MYFEKLSNSRNPYARELRDCDRYIIHLVNKTPKNKDELLTKTIMKKYRPIGRPLRARALELIYANTTSEFKKATDVGKKYKSAPGHTSKLKYHSSRTVTISRNPYIHAVII
jgi:hypothetical protein